MDRTHNVPTTKTTYNHIRATSPSVSWAREIFFTSGANSHAPIKEMTNRAQKYSPSKLPQGVKPIGFLVLAQRAHHPTRVTSCFSTDRPLLGLSAKRPSGQCRKPVSALPPQMSPMLIWPIFSSVARPAAFAPPRDTPASLKCADKYSGAFL
jgi:hypothetical protein